jgi:GTP-binding protein
MFVDKAKIYVKAGDGGDGCCSFRREKYVPKGGPDGGDGGNGGDVVLVTDVGEQSLVDLVYNQHVKAERGVHGKGKKLHGKRGKDMIVKIPPGTLVKDFETKELIIDMDQPGQEYIIAYGGRGGRGNPRYASSVNRAPMQKEEGLPGDEKVIELELKTIADIGLVGFPNAGKSTFLGSVSHAHPKTAPYPFTTLHPVVGIVEFPDYVKMKIADIPGLIMGAHENIGLGHSFLKHIERTKLLVYVLDTAGVDGRTPWEDFEVLQNELEMYMKGLSKRPGIILANKTDLPESEENLELLQEAVEGYEIVPICAELDENFDDLLLKLRKILNL